ncbi:hypothetical protein IT568_00040 [bacterium]|nr:hypothetical protein [bacterium]
MKKTIFSLILAINLLNFSQAQEKLQKTEELDDAKKQEVLDKVKKNLSIYFTENKGQWHEDVRFKSNGVGAEMWFCDYGTTFLLTRPKQEDPKIEGEKKEVKPKKEEKDDKESLFSTSRKSGKMDEPERPEMEGFVIKLSFLNRNPNAKYVGDDRRSWDNNYFIGNDSTKWRPSVPNWGKISLKNVWDKIDIGYFENQRQIKYTFVVNPGGKPEDIVLNYDFGEKTAGAGINFASKGELDIQTPFGNFSEGVPKVYQEIGKNKVSVPCAYKKITSVVDAKTKKTVTLSNAYGFQLGSYDKTKPLYIDPAYDFSKIVK